MNLEEYKARVLLELVTQNVPSEYKWVAVDDTNSTGKKTTFLYNNMPNLYVDGWMPHRCSNSFRLGYEVLIENVNIDFDWKESLISIEELFDD